MRRSFIGSSSIGSIFTLLAVACSSDREIAGPDPEPTGPPVELLGSAIRLHVDLRGGKVTVTHLSLVEATPERNGLKPSFALLGQNEIEAEVTEVSRSAVGEFTHNRVRVILNLALRNRLLNADLVPSTFPAPPSAQVVAFPFATVPAGLFGLKVRASPDWDGAPHNFFNDGLCLGLPTPPADCFRWEGFGAELEAGATTEARKVGFDVDPSVTSFTVDVAVAADIDERPSLPPAACLPSEPREVIALRGDQQLSVSWSRPASTGCGPVTDYVVSISPGRQTTTSGATSANIIGLTNGTVYTITIAAMNVVGTGASSVPAVVVPVGLPGAPSLVDLRAFRDPSHEGALSNTGVAFVTWAAASSNGGTILRYEITCIDPSPTSGVLLGGNSVPGDHLTAQVRFDDLRDGDGAPVMFVACSVAAVNEAGPGPGSERAEAGLGSAALRDS